MSRLAAQKEYAFLQVLHQHGFPVPTPIDQSRHCIVMSLVQGYPLSQIHDLGNPEQVYTQLMDLIEKLAKHGLIHCDFNEFNIMITEDDQVVMIDFPQMISTSHVNAAVYFARDVECVKKFFRRRLLIRYRRFDYTSSYFPKFDPEVYCRGGAKPGKSYNDANQPEFVRLDQLVAASGFSNGLQSQLEGYQKDVCNLENNDGEEEEEDQDECIESFENDTLQDIHEPLEASHIENYQSVPLIADHRDPFDRILIATALHENLSIITIDEKFENYKHIINVIW